MSSAIPRKVEMQFSHQLFAATTYYLSLPRQALSLVDAIVVFPGLGEWERVSSAIRLWQNPASVARYLIIEGHNNREYTQRVLTEEVLKQEFDLTKTEGVHIRVHAENTLDQATHVAALVHELDITSLALCAPSYHNPRGFFTLLQALRAAGIPDMPIIPATTPSGPDRLVPEYEIDNIVAWDMAGSECDRIEKYGLKGDLVTPGSVKDYLAWLYRQPIVKQFLS